MGNAGPLKGSTEPPRFQAQGERWAPAHGQAQLILDAFSILSLISLENDAAAVDSALVPVHERDGAFRAAAVLRGVAGQGADIATQRRETDRVSQGARGCEADEFGVRRVGAGQAVGLQFV